MTERLLHFIWQFGYFNRSELATVNGEPVQILSPGRYNTNQGPDFLDAKICIPPATWAGHVELHLKSSDWKKHQHDKDRQYDNVVLHVVWEHDDRFERAPVLELKGRVPRLLLQQYEEMMHGASFIPCEKMIGGVQALQWKSWKDRLLAERLTRKALVVQQMLDQNNQHWEETFWWMLARNFGGPVNGAAFEEMARSIPVALLVRHKNQLQQLEALLFGQAGLLQEEYPADAYYQLLQREYHFLQKKYGLQMIRQSVQFLRMRPGNFPTVRLAQLAVLLQGAVPLFARVRDAEHPGEVLQMLDITANDYWHYHYRFGETGAFREKKLGAVMAASVLINSIVPVLFAHGLYNDHKATRDKALQWLEAAAAEQNSITNGFTALGIANAHADDSQSLIELKKEYCDKKRCLECAVGRFLLQQPPGRSS